MQNNIVPNYYMPNYENQYDDYYPSKYRLRNNLMNPPQMQYPWGFPERRHERVPENYIDEYPPNPNNSRMNRPNQNMEPFNNPNNKPRVRPREETDEYLNRGELNDYHNPYEYGSRQNSFPGTTFLPYNFQYNPYMPPPQTARLGINPAWQGNPVMDNQMNPGFGQEYYQPEYTRNNNRMMPNEMTRTRKTNPTSQYRNPQQDMQCCDTNWMNRNMNYPESSRVNNSKYIRE